MIEHWKDRRAEQQKLLDWLGRETAVVTEDCGPGRVDIKPRMKANLQTSIDQYDKLISEAEAVLDRGSATSRHRG